MKKGLAATQVDELRRCRHKNYLLLLAIRRRCKSCLGGRVDLINKCESVKCPLWVFRRGPVTLNEVMGRS